MRNFFTLTVLFAMFMGSCQPTEKKHSNTSRKDTLVILQNEQMAVSFSLWGGAITDFHLKESGVNPFTWKITREEMQMDNADGVPFQGHFLCFGRWGSPEKGEAAAGIPNNGEPAENWWELVSRDEISLEMRFNAPVEKMNVGRQVRISENEALVVVTEKYTNPNDFGRIFNVVQHPTAGRPFLSEASLVSTNATLGFMQSLAVHGLERYQYKWPDGYADSLLAPVDLTRSDQEMGFVTTHIIDDEYGWVTLSDPDHDLLLGYVWKSSEYPWLHIWHGMKEGRLWAKGLEFGTTGIGDTFPPEKRFAMDFHGRRNFEFYDARETKAKSYIFFMVSLPGDFSGIESVFVYPDRISVIPAGETAKTDLGLEGINPWK